MATPACLGTSFESVLDAARQAAPWALEALYRHLQPAVVAYLRTQEPSEAEDLASETWIDVARGIGRFSGDEAAFRRFVFAIARRRVIDVRRARRRRRTQATPTEVLAKRPGTDDVAATALEAIAGEKLLALVTSVLSADQAEVVVLRVLAGLDTDAVAAIVGKRPATVRVIAHRALRRLAHAVDEGAVTPSDLEAM
jgi:RNA polymerase sigma-70 factor (ECF subfamily)